MINNNNCKDEISGLGIVIETYRWRHGLSLCLKAHNKVTVTVLLVSLKSRTVEILTVFADQKVQVAVGVGHAHLGLHLWSLQGGVNLPWTVLLRGRFHLAQPAAHGSTVCQSLCAQILPARQNRLRQCSIHSVCGM